MVYSERVDRKCPDFSQLTPSSAITRRFISYPIWCIARQKTSCVRPKLGNSALFFFFLILYKKHWKPNFTSQETYFALSCSNLVRKYQLVLLVCDSVLTFFPNKHLPVISEISRVTLKMCDLDDVTCERART